MDYRALLAAPLAALMLGVGAAEVRMPAGWISHSVGMPAHHTGPTAPGPVYDMGLDAEEAAVGRRSLTIRSIAAIAPEAQAAGVISQPLHGYAGQRVRLTAQLRSRQVRGWAGLFIGPGPATVPHELSLGAPGVEHRLPMGGAAPADGAGWQEVSVVFDAPADTTALQLGLVLAGEGQVWARDLRFDVVGPQVPVTRTPVGIDWAAGRAHREKNRRFLATLPPAPLRNASFE